MMTREEIETEIAKSVGENINVDFGNGPETVRVVSVDPDGFVCHPESSADSSAEFWVAYKAVVSASRTT
jgi:hypothetical protein